MAGTAKKPPKESKHRRYAAERIQELAEAVLHHKRVYYAGKPEISDQAFDALEEELRKLSPEHPVLAFVGTEESIGGAKVTHDQPMLSLQKTYDREELLSWRDNHAVVGTWKVDGVSLSLVYEGGRLKLAKTRGNGRIGEDVTDKARWIADIVPQLPEPWHVEVRGELYCTESQFARLATEMLAGGLERPTSPRNIVAGLLGRKTRFEFVRYFNFLAFDILPCGDAARAELRKIVKDEWSKFAVLGDAGFRRPGAQLIASTEELDKFLAEVKEVADGDEIGIDGAVFAYNDLKLRDEMGETSHHPRYKMSFKWPGATAQSVIEKIIWNTSRLGVVTPVAVIQPVELSGATITNITLHNAANVRAYNLKRGDAIELIRSGEVIPKFLSVVKESSGSYVWPKTCEACHAELLFDDVRLICPNAESCPAQRLGGILNWIVAADIEDVSEKRLEMLMQMGLVHDVQDLYRLAVQDFLRMPQTKDKMASKLFVNIQKSRNLPLARFLLGLGIQGAGLTTWEKLLDVFHDLPTLQKASAEAIQAIDGFAEKSAEQITQGLARKHQLISNLLAVGVKPAAHRLRDASQLPLAGKQIVITGALSRPRNEIEALIKDAGGSPGSSVSKNTFALVTEEVHSTSSKMQKARALGIPIWNEAELLAAIQRKDA